MKVLILGGSGLVGSNLNKYLSDFYQVRTTSRSADNADFVFDISKPDTYGVLDESWDVIINCIVDYDLSLDLKIQNEVYYKANLLRHIVKLNCHFIDISSISALDENKFLSDYNFSKFLSEEVISYYEKKTKANFAVLRFAQIFDLEGKARRMQKALYYFIDAVKSGVTVNLMGNPQIKRSYMPIEILTKAVKLVIEKKIGGFHNVIMPDRYGNEDLIESFKNILGVSELDISFRPQELVMEYYIPECSADFKLFLASEPNCSVYFNKLLKE